MRRVTQMEEALEAFDIALHHILIAGDSFGIGKEDAEHAADVAKWRSRAYMKPSPS
jgi:hypothetical protein